MKEKLKPLLNLAFVVGTVCVSIVLLYIATVLFQNFIN
jgi:hypothetical protein